MSSPDAAARRLDARAVASALDRMARASEPPWLHTEVARRMAERLGVIRLRPAHLLDWWGWLGAGGERLGAAYPQARRSIVEPTPRLVERSAAAARTPWWSASRWRQGAVDVRLDAPGASPLPGGVELIWANMALQFVCDPPALFERWHQLLAAGGFVMFSCLGPGTLRELRGLFDAAGWGAVTPGFVDMHDLGDMLVHAGFADPVMDQETLDLRWESPQALLAELRTLGGNTAPDRFKGLRTPRWRACLLRELESLRGTDGRLALSFEVAYGHAFKSAPRLRPGEATSVSLDDMRAMVRSSRSRGDT